MRIAILLSLALFAGGCSSNARQEVVTEKRTVTITKTMAQTFAPNGDLVLLESVTKTVTDENGSQVGETETVHRPPQILSYAAKAVGAGVTALTGSGAAGEIAEQGVDWLTGLLGAGAAGGTAAGTGYMAVRRTRRQRDELIEGIEKSKDVLGDEAWEKVKAKLASVQSADTQRAIWEATP